MIIGAGAIGCLLGAKLAQVGQAVTLVGRPAFAEAVTANGLVLQDEHGQHTIRNLNAVGSIAAAFALPDTLFDIAILTVKSYDTQAAMQEFQNAQQHAPEGATLPTVLSMQNGVGNEAAIAEILGNDKVIAGTLTTPAQVPQPGLVVVERPSYTVGISPWHSSTATILVDASHHAFEQAGFDIRTYDNPVGMKWTKLLMNMVGNATSAILDLPPNQAFTDPRVVALEVGAWREVFSVLRAARISPVNLGSYPLAWLGYMIWVMPNATLGYLLRSRVRSARGAKMPSLHGDLQRGKSQSEVDWLNGAVVNLGQKYRLQTPINRALTEIIHRLIEFPEERALFRHNVARLVEQVYQFRHR